MDNLHQLRLPAEERIPELAEGHIPVEPAEHNPEEGPEADNPVAQRAAVLLPAS